MNQPIGVWINRHEAVIVINPERAAQITRLTAPDPRPENAYARVSRYQQAASDEAYYDAVVEQVRGADALLIVGAEAARLGLEQRLIAHGLGDRLIGVESAPAMSDSQLVSAMRQYFHEAAMVIG